MIRAALLILATLLPGAAMAADMAVFVKNGQPAAVAVELHGRASVWPGGDKVWEIEPGMKKSIPIECEAGERLCYAAWVSGAASTSAFTSIIGGRLASSAPARPHSSVRVAAGSTAWT